MGPSEASYSLAGEGQAGSWSPTITCSAVRESGAVLDPCNAPSWIAAFAAMTMCPVGAGTVTGMEKALRLNDDVRGQREEG